MQCCNAVLHIIVYYINTDLFTCILKSLYLLYYRIRYSEQFPSLSLETAQCFLEFAFLILVGVFLSSHVNYRISSPTGSCAGELMRGSGLMLSQVKTSLAHST